MKTKALFYTILFSISAAAATVGLLLDVDNASKWLAPLLAVLAIRSYREYKAK